MDGRGEHAKEMAKAGPGAASNANDAVRVAYAALQSRFNRGFKAAVVEDAAVVTGAVEAAPGVAAPEAVTTASLYADHKREQRALETAADADR
eukprot:gene15081-58076_t